MSTKVNHAAETRDLINEHLLPEIRDILSTNEEFLRKEIQSFRSLEENLDSHIMNLSKKKDEYQTNVTQLTKKAQHHSETQKKGDKYIDEKKEDLIVQQKNIDSAMNCIRESCSQMKTRDFAQLEAETNEFILNIFKNLFVLLYDEPESQFEWKTFKREALEQNDGIDFQSRLAGFDIRKNFGNQEKDRKIAEINSDNRWQSTEMVEILKKCPSLIDLSDWFEYSSSGLTFVQNRHTALIEFKQIERDMKTRDIEAQHATESQDFWNQTSKECANFIEFYDKIQKSFKTTELEFHNSNKNLSAHREKQLSYINSVNSEIKA